ncbi:GNAT family N-acetyltransferase [Fredinandcohnia sp. 179-A 10B2 NHS]|uniref:GNAT family N-acetyltransferase n=1 Tax=Fredinandcohnia sp. 179-A 10B2 NHS TaxID=3235176 RepID=UPI0039A356D8
MTQTIQFKKITKENWEEAFSISVMDNQRTFVPSVAESLAYAYLKPWDEALEPYAIYVNEEIIGMFYLSYTPDSEKNYWIGGFQVDKKHQGKGLGRKSLEEILKFIKETHPRCKVINLTVEKENTHAIHLYESVGFISQYKENDYGELIFKKEFIN